ncbi:MAG: hypothetical protein ACRDQX_14960, partial [Pseudonocardiaceae bacterium]
SVHRRPATDRRHHEPQGLTPAQRAARLRYASLVEWTAATIRRFREVGLCLPRDKFAKELGFAKRTVGNAERGATSPSLALRRALDQALEKATDAQRDRFLAHSLTTGPIVAPQQVYGQSNVLLPVVIDGRQVLLPMDAAAVAGRGLALAMNLVPSIGDPARLEAKPVNVERAYELYLRGQGLLATNDKQRIAAATTLLDSALGIDPCFARAQAARGYAHWRRYFSGWESDLSTLEQALSDVDAALRLDPDSIGARSTLIRICWDMGWHERALEIGRALREKNPDSLDATLAFARALNNAGMAEAALPLTRAVLRADPTNPTAAKLLIWNHLMVSDYSSALEAACLYLPAHPQDSTRAGRSHWPISVLRISTAPSVLPETLSPQTLMTSRSGTCSATCTGFVVRRSLRNIPGRLGSSMLRRARRRRARHSLARSHGWRTSRHALVTPSEPARRSHG